MGVRLACLWSSHWGKRVAGSATAAGDYTDSMIQNVPSAVRDPASPARSTVIDGIIRNKSLLVSVDIHIHMHAYVYMHTQTQTPKGTLKTCT